MRKYYHENKEEINARRRRRRVEGQPTKERDPRYVGPSWVIVYRIENGEVKKVGSLIVEGPPQTTRISQIYVKVPSKVNFTPEDLSKHEEGPL